MASKVLGEDNNIKEQHRYWAGDIDNIIFICTAYQCRLQQYYSSDTKGRDTKVQYQLMNCVL